ncbi:lysin [Furfurilactobacillus rossiae DSM 15814]|uniref:Lysin n=2 Tax=Furfurilactobacillus rossiae TaxID=231049 RepID=A0A0R1RJJ0_9LACO|nr:lysin [Furfurilactobacillus rossiae DSM 15814]
MAAFSLALFSGDTQKASAYVVNTQYAFGAGQGSPYQTNNKFVVLHDTATEASAANTASYFDNNWNVAFTSATYVVGDGGAVYQVEQPGYQAWAAGTYANANAPVQIELAHTYDWNTFKADYESYIKLAHDSAVRYGINPGSFNHVNGGIITHRFVSENWWGDHVDPMEYIQGRWGVSAETLANDIATGVSSLGTSTINVPQAQTTVQQPVQPSASVHANPTIGTFTFAATTNIRSGAGLSNNVLGQYEAGQSVNYERVAYADGYKWLGYTSFSGRQCWVAVLSGNVAQSSQSTTNLVPQTGAYVPYGMKYVRNAPSTQTGDIKAYYNAGMAISYDGYVDSEGYRWISYIGASGNRAYVAEKILSNGQRLGYCY